ncbi:MAG: PHP domain-containing protein, partial [Actinobacteria bacterium]|nr:PHP domain-containing protein [Actinomycetota bacterium]
MFTHLHVHSHYSLLESSARIDSLVETAARLGMRSLALTDKYVMSGAVEFYRLAKAKGIKPITGCEICLAQSHPVTYHPLPSHLTLLVKNRKGYENLCRLVSKSHIEHVKNTGHHEYGIPAVEFNDLERFSEGLICLSGCSKGRLSRLLKANNMYEAKKFALNLFNVFGQDLYIEIQRYGFTGPGSNSGSIQDLSFRSDSALGSRADIASEILAVFSQKIKIPAVATNNVHYLARNDYSTYRYLSKIRLMGTKKDPTGNMLENDEHYLKSAMEMSKMFRDIPGAIKNTQIIAEKCNFDFELGKISLPNFETPDGESQHYYLETLCLEGLKSRFGICLSSKVTDRLTRELEIIRNTGFAGYFLVAADIARFAYQNSIPICGKGSAAGSLVSYLLRISNVDPIENNLYFERFLNEERKEPPDIDI